MCHRYQGFQVVREVYVGSRRRDCMLHGKDVARETRHAALSLAGALPFVVPLHPEQVPSNAKENLRLHCERRHLA